MAWGMVTDLFEKDHYKITSLSFYGNLGSSGLTILNGPVIRDNIFHDITGIFKI